MAESYLYEVLLIARALVSTPRAYIRTPAVSQATAYVDRAALKEKKTGSRGPTIMPTLAIEPLLPMPVPLRSDGKDSGV